jgi:PIN domain nuclease of toxin-antitoxin system
VKVLLDTHVALWAMQEEGRIGRKARLTIHGAEEIQVSVVVPWELGIKAALGRIDLARPIAHLVRGLEEEFGALVLPVKLDHVLTAVALPPHHGDPFDRLLIAQALVEGLTVVTHDATFARYGVKTVVA